jgi:hypothetical protein
MSNIVVLFQSDSEHVEQMALAVAVGAVEAEGSIRLRRLAAVGAAEVGHKGYGRLQRADLLWADTVVTGLESVTPRAEELDGLLQLLTGFDPGELDGKHAWTFGPEGLGSSRTEAQAFVEAALQVAKFTVLSAAALGVAHADNMIDRLKEAGRRSVRGLTSVENA